jgi:tripartite-type tricarboxylate transporter receptor subunit TctC
VLTNGTTIAETLYEDLPYDVTEDLAPISAWTWFDLVLLTHPGSGYQTLDDIIDRGRTAGGMRIGTINPGSTQNLTARYFISRTGIEATVIPYRTTPDVLGALLRNEVDVAIDAYTALKGAIDGGQARPLAVTGAARNPAMPGVPTVQETGVEDFVVTGWNALYTHAGAPPTVVERLHDEIEAVAALPEIQEQFSTLGAVARATSPDEIQAQLLGDIERWRIVIESSGIAGP